MAYDAFIFGPVFNNNEQKRRRNKGDVHGQKKRARARKMGAPRVELTGRQWKGILARFSYECAYCGSHFVDTGPLTQDHIVPLSRGGAHNRTNVVPACLSCNSSKQDLTAGEFFEKLLREKLS